MSEGTLVSFTHAQCYAYPLGFLLCHRHESKPETARIRNNNLEKSMQCRERMYG